MFKKIVSMICILCLFLTTNGFSRAQVDATSSATSTPTATPTITPSPTGTPTLTPSPSPSPSPTPTMTITSTSTQMTATPTPSITPTPTVTPNGTLTPSMTPMPLITLIPTPSPSPTPEPTPTPAPPPVRDTLFIQGQDVAQSMDLIESTLLIPGASVAILGINVDIEPLLTKLAINFVVPRSLSQEQQPLLETTPTAQYKSYNDALSTLCQVFYHDGYSLRRLEVTLIAPIHFDVKAYIARPEFQEELEQDIVQITHRQMDVPLFSSIDRVCYYYGSISIQYGSPKITYLGKTLTAYLVQRMMEEEAEYDYFVINTIGAVWSSFSEQEEEGTISSLITGLRLSISGMRGEDTILSFSPSAPTTTLSPQCDVPYGAGIIGAEGMGSSFQWRGMPACLQASGSGSLFSLELVSNDDLLLNWLGEEPFIVQSAALFKSMTGTFLLHVQTALGCEFLGEGTSRYMGSIMSFQTTY